MTDRLDHEDLVTRVHQLEEEVQELNHEKAGLLSELNTTRALYGFVSSLGMSPSLVESLQFIADRIREFFCADGSCIALFDENSDKLRVCADSGKKIENLLGRGFHADRLKSSRAGEKYIFRAKVEKDPVATRIIGMEDILSGMTAPIRMASHCFGFAYVFSQKEIFTDTCLESFSWLTKHAAAEIQRSKTEQLLRESEERFRFMAETTGDVIYRLKYDTMTYDYLSPGILKLTGYSRDEIEEFGFGKLILRIDTPTEKNISSKSIINNRLEGKTGEFRADYLLKTRAGELRWVRDHSFPWYDESAAIVGSVGILSDVSDYKRAEAQIEQRTDELIESEERYRTLVENVPLVVYRMRAGAQVFFLNQFVEQVFGFRAGEILRSPELWQARLHREDGSRVAKLRDISFKEGKEFFAEYRIIHKDGHLVYVLDHAVPFRSADGRISSLDGIIMDMTGRVRLQEQLVQAEGLKTISEVSQRLAHEIRNPLVSAGGFARLLLSSMASSDPNREKVEIIVREVARLETILRTIINYIQPLE
ncbi:MAG: PAS domain S-box protein, partial [Desulfoferrobacter sp.]